jgi:hypothetical protein
VIEQRTVERALLERLDWSGNARWIAGAPPQPLMGDMSA